LIQNAFQSYFDLDSTCQNHCAAVLKHFPLRLNRGDSQLLFPKRV
jgi:hypothetical protein